MLECLGSIARNKYFQYAYRFQHVAYCCFNESTKMGKVSGHTKIKKIGLYCFTIIDSLLLYFVLQTKCSKKKKDQIEIRESSLNYIAYKI